MSVELIRPARSQETKKGGLKIDLAPALPQHQQHESEEHPSDMREMGDIRPRLRHPEEEFEHPVRHDEPFGFHRNRRDKQHDTIVRVKHPEREQHPEDRPRSPDRHHQVAPPTEYDFGRIGRQEMPVLQPVDPQVTKPGPHAADQVVDQKPPRPHIVFEYAPEHPQSEHIKEQVLKPAMQEHVSDRLPKPEILSLPKVESEKVGHPLAPDPLRQQRLCQENYDIQENKIHHDALAPRGSTAVSARSEKVIITHDFSVCFTNSRRAGPLGPGPPPAVRATSSDELRRPARGGGGARDSKSRSCSTCRTAL